MPALDLLRSCLVNPARAILGQEKLLDLFFAAYWPARDLGAPIVSAGRRLAVMSMWDAAQADLAAITAPNKAAYCQRHGYAWLPCTDGFDPSRPVAWSKLVFLRHHLPAYDWIMWSDADSLITNPAIRIESLIRSRADLLLTRDKVGFNSGSFLIRNCHWAWAFLDELWAYPTQPSYSRQYDVWTDRLWENRALLQLLLVFHHRTHCRVIAQRRINSYLADERRPDPRADHQPHDFVLHLAGMEPGVRLRVLSDYARRPAPGRPGRTT